ncbi:AraC family transcriptional regulator [Bosea minatitlanensis]|uniref:GyrI-like domain-containing protein n=1 Tax=Bosea minatitlanensis TaxID=128782 RepID=A0ABW0F3S1_9HYPH|nr:AraC family transcriptional regulator [Bosea minatitlanensis]MCT4493771.1 AraC family transcriptional regulator [Bosea minatitlanensis]
MDPVKAAVWFIESHFTSDLSLDEIAQACGVSRFHLCRAFGNATGRPVMRYVRERRLTEAARQLAQGAPDILSVALDWGYGSHEAFTRAFREQFGLTPEALRGRRDLASLELVEPLAMNSIPSVILDEPRIQRGKAMLLAGFGSRFGYEAFNGIPALWRRLASHLGHIPGQVGEVCYGVSHAADENGVDYLAGVEVASFGDLPPAFDRIRIPEQVYAVFTHHGHVTAIKGTFDAIWNEWLPRSGRKPAESPSFERYDERFDSQTGTGIVEVWVPVEG